MSETKTTPQTVSKTVPKTVSKVIRKKIKQTNENHVASNLLKTFDEMDDSNKTDEVNDLKLTSTKYLHKYKLETASRRIITDEITKDGRFSFDLIDGHSHYDCIIKLKNEDKFVGVQLKCRTVDKCNEKDQYRFGRTHGYDGMFIIGMIISVNWNRCTGVYYNFGSIMNNMAQRPQITIEKSFIDCFDWMETELKILAKTNQHDKLKIITKDEAEMALSVQQRTEKINRDTFTKLCPFLKISQPDTYYTPIDFYIDYKDLKVSVQLKAFNKSKGHYGDKCDFEKKYQGSRNSYNLKDGIDLFLISYSNEKRFHRAYILTTWELYTNGFIDLIQYDDRLCLKTLYAYPPGTEQNEYYRSSRDRSAWANIGYFEYNVGLEEFIHKKMLQAINERVLIAEELQNKAYLPPPIKTIISWSEAVIDILPEFIKRINRKEFAIYELYDMYWDELIEKTGSTSICKSDTILHTLKIIIKSNNGLLEKLGKEEAKKYRPKNGKPNANNITIYRYKGAKLP